MEWTDDYFWLRDRHDPSVLAHLRAENEYTEATLAHLADLRSAVCDEIKAKVAEDDLSAPARQGEWWYGHRTEKGRQYPIFQRWRGGPEGPPTVLIDQNELAGENAFCAMGHLHFDESQNRLAYSVDFSGNETFEIRFLEIEPRGDLVDRIEGASYGGAWSANGEHFFHTTLDAAHRPYRAWNHRLGTPRADDLLVYEETDRRFDLYLYESRDGSQIAGVIPFAGHVVVVGRKQGNPVLSLRPDSGTDAFDLAFAEAGRWAGFGISTAAWRTRPTRSSISSPRASISSPRTFPAEEIWLPAASPPAVF